MARLSEGLARRFCLCLCGLACGDRPRRRRRRRRGDVTVWRIVRFLSGKRTQNKPSAPWDVSLASSHSDIAPLFCFSNNKKETHQNNTVELNCLRCNTVPQTIQNLHSLSSSRPWNRFTLAMFNVSGHTARPPSFGLRTSKPSSSSPPEEEDAITEEFQSLGLAKHKTHGGPPTGHGGTVPQQPRTFP